MLGRAFDRVLGWYCRRRVKRIPDNVLQFKIDKHQDMRDRLELVFELLVGLGMPGIIMNRLHILHLNFGNVRDYYMTEAIRRVFGK